MEYRSIKINEKLNLINDHWKPRVIAELNDYQFKLVKIKGDFVWHSHAETDEAFMVIQGQLRIDFRDGFVDLGPGELYIVPKGVEHKPYAEEEVQMMLIEPKGVVNTGELENNNKRAANDVWI